MRFITSNNFWVNIDDIAGLQQFGNETLVILRSGATMRFPEPFEQFTKKLADVLRNK